MTTERMTVDEMFEEECWDALRKEAMRLKDEAASLREQLRLANDKMAEQVRQARWEVADDLLASWHATPSAKAMDLLLALERIRDANAPKD